MFTARRLKLILGLYWVGLFVLTHLPKGPVSKPLLFPHQDKVEHFIGYGILAGLAALVSRRSKGKMRYGTWLLILGIYAAFDELTQPLVGRHDDIWDWAADMAGVSLAFVLVHRLLRRRGPADVR